MDDPIYSLRMALTEMESGPKQIDIAQMSELVSVLGQLMRTRPVLVLQALARSAEIAGGS